MTIQQLTDVDKRALTEVIDQGVAVTSDIKVQRDGLRDAVKDVAARLGLKPKVINQAIRAQYKRNLSEIQDDVDLISQLLSAAGQQQ